MDRAGKRERYDVLLFVEDFMWKKPVALVNMAHYASQRAQIIRLTLLLLFVLILIWFFMCMM